MAIQYQEPLDRIFHALGDGTRRQILSMLAIDGTLSANEIRKPFEVAQPTISKHLKVLERAKLVSREVHGRTHCFRLDAETLANAEDWIVRHKQFWEGTLRQLDEFVTNVELSGSER